MQSNSFVLNDRLVLQTIVRLVHVVPVRLFLEKCHYHVEYSVLISLVIPLFFSSISSFRTDRRLTSNFYGLHWLIEPHLQPQQLHSQYFVRLSFISILFPVSIAEKLFYLAQFFLSYNYL